MAGAHVIFRNLLSSEAEDVSFTLDQPYSVAFAAWDGANGERNGEKSTSQWVTLQLASVAAAAPPPQPQPSASDVGVFPAYIGWGFYAASAHRWLCLHLLPSP